MAASTAAVLDAESLAKIRTLLAAGTSEGVSLGLTLLESLGATVADLDAALAPPAGAAVAAVADRWLLGDGWSEGDLRARSEYDRYHEHVVAPRFYRDREADRQAGRSFLDLVEIPAGEFEMGSEHHASDEKPVHRVRITRAFCFGKTTVTQGQWWSVMGTRPWLGQDYVKEGADVAASYVSWDDAVEFCARLTKFEQSSGTLHGNQQYRLPTEAEWEYACRAGTTTRFSFGDDESRMGEFAWFDGNADSAGEQYAHEVGKKKPNPWGLHDMHGNVWEWCSDWYDKKYYAQSPAVDPKGPDAGSYRVIRGGGWDDFPINCRSARRYFGTPARRDGVVGFRVVLSVE